MVFCDPVPLNKNYHFCIQPGMDGKQRDTILHIINFDQQLGV